MAKTVDLEELLNPKAGLAGIRRKACRFGGLVRYRLLPRYFNLPTRLGALGGSFFRHGITLGIAATPLYFKYLAQLPAVSNSAIWISFGILGMQATGAVYDAAWKGRKESGDRKAHRSKIPYLTTDIVRRIGAQVAQALAHPVLQSHERDYLKTKILECMLHSVATELGDLQKRYLQVTLILYDSEEGDYMKVAGRGEAGRQSGARRRSEEFWAHRVAKTRNHFAVHNYRGPGISTDKAPYRSILFVPIIEKSEHELHDGREVFRCMGVLSFDSELPYHFWGMDAELVRQIQPLTELLRLVLKSTAHTVVV